MYELSYDHDTCAKCRTLECLVKCQYMDLDLEAARHEKQRMLAGEHSRVLSECATCYACEEYCPDGNYPFLQIVDLQERLEVWPVPLPLTNQQIKLMAPRGKIDHQSVEAPVIDMCTFPMLAGCIRGKLFEGATTIWGSDIFCNIMWLHFAKNSVIRERVPKTIDNIYNYYLRDSGVDELVCFHDECYGTFTKVAPAFGMEVPFKPVHLFEYLARKLTELKSEITPIRQRVAYQRPCSNRLVPETQHWLDEIFALIGAEKVDREYEGENALCCAMSIRAMQNDELADDLQQRNVDDMKACGASYGVFNCPVCMFTLGPSVSEAAMAPVLISDLCQMALGQGGR